MEYSVSVQDLIDEYGLITLTKEGGALNKRYITHADVNRLALQLTGYFEYFASNRIQLIGLVESSYIDSMSSEARGRILRELFKRDFPCVVITRNLSPHPELLHIAELYGVPLLQYPQSTSEFMGEVLRWLKVQLAPMVTVHGVLVDVYGEGILLMGESGIGKSETALELIKRGHRFVADDAVEIKRVSTQTLIGSCPELIRYFIELRGIGIIDVRQMFGVQSIKATQSIDLVIKLEAWDKTKQYERFGLQDEYHEILGNKVVCHTIPVRPGRNLAIICESSAINHRQKKMGYNGAMAMDERVRRNIEGAGE